MKNTTIFGITLFVTTLISIFLVHGIVYEISFNLKDLFYPPHDARVISYVLGAMLFDAILFISIRKPIKDLFGEKKND